MIVRLLIVQYTSDYREAVKRFAAGGDETYYAQKYFVNAIAEIGEKIDEAAVFSCIAEKSYNQILENGVRAIGTGFEQKIQARRLFELFEEYSPTHLVTMTPIRDILDWAIKRRVKTIVTMADSFNSKGLRSKIQYYRLARLLNNRQIDWIGNHNIPASQSLIKIGVNPDKIIPWDFPPSVTPDSFSPKTLPVDGNPRKIFYVGAISEAKGVGDALEAVSLLKSKGLSLKLKLAGKGDVENFINKARDLQIEDCVEFLGLVPNKTIINLMREADLVLVPSRHEYPEGFPFVIYESLCSRTPIVASDHPMFRSKLVDRTSALIFPSGDPVALALSIEKLLSDPQLYQNLSTASYDVWKRLQIPVKWADLVNCWLFDSPENKQWLFKNRLSSGQYSQMTT